MVGCFFGRLLALLVDWLGGLVVLFLGCSVVLAAGWAVVGAHWHHNKRLKTRTIETNVLDPNKQHQDNTGCEREGKLQPVNARNNKEMSIHRMEGHLKLQHQLNLFAGKSMSDIDAQSPEHERELPGRYFNPQ